METIIAVTPAHLLDPQIAIAASKAGEVGLLDLGYGNRTDSIVRAIEELRGAAGKPGRWGVRWDLLGSHFGEPSDLAERVPSQVPILALAGVPMSDAAELRKAAQTVAGQVLLEVSSYDDAAAAQAAGYDGLIVKGHEAGGRVGGTSSFMLLQELNRKISIPYWIQGGIGRHSAAAAILAGATGFVLAEQLWLTEEGPCQFSEDRALWRELDGSETSLIGENAELFRFFARSGRRRLRELELAVARGDDWRALLHKELLEHDDPLVPIGQDIALAAAIARRHGTTGRAIGAFRDGIGELLSRARSQKILAADSPLARQHGTRFPIAQGPMTRVSDVAPFAAAVAEAGGLPFLALAVLRGPQVTTLLTGTKEGRRSPSRLAHLDRLTRSPGNGLVESGLVRSQIGRAIGILFDFARWIRE